MSGCSAHRAYLYDRGGSRRITELKPLTQVRWSRVRDDQSSGNIFMANPDRSCWSALDNLDSARHELVIYRNGKRVWEGPLVRDDDSDGLIEIDARDITFYLERTVMRRAYDNSYPRIIFGTERLRHILVAEVARKEAITPPVNILANLDIRTTADTAKTARATLPFESNVYEELDGMAAKSGIDYTVVGRKLVIFDTDLVIGQGPRLTDKDFTGGLAVTGYGRETATFVAVTDGQGKSATFGGTDTYYGERELLYTTFQQGDSTAAATTITTNEMTKQARRNIAGRYPTPRIVRVPSGSTLNPTTADQIMDDLVPGVRFPVLASKTYRRLQQVQKLDKVEFLEDSSGESISVSLSPAPGTTPWDDTGGTPPE